MSNRPKIPCKNTILLRREQQQECRQIERNHIQELVTDTYLAIEQRDEAWDEIERLKEELSNESSQHEAETQRLREMLTEGDKVRGEYLNAIYVAKDRIEELEKERDDACGAIVLKIKSLKGHHITDEQIDAAWRSCHEQHQPKINAVERLRVLKILNIVRCEECKGHGKFMDIPPYESRCEYKKCPACNGHGWIIASDAINEKRSTGDE